MAICGMRLVPACRRFQSETSSTLDVSAIRARPKKRRLKANHTFHSHLLDNCSWNCWPVIAAVPEHVKLKGGRDHGHTQRLLDRYWLSLYFRLSRGGEILWSRKLLLVGKKSAEPISTLFLCAQVAAVGVSLLCGRRYRGAVQRGTLL